MAHASTVADYQKLATYFHQQEILYRAKAQRVLDDYNQASYRYTMATKTVSRAQVEDRDYTSYMNKARENGAQAEYYDDKIREAGGKPQAFSSAVVSVKQLGKESTRPVGSALSDSRPPNQ